MGILTDWQIERDVKITPFEPAQKRPGVVSYGCTSYGYDVRCGYKFLVLKAYPAGAVLDPKAFDKEALFHEVDLTPPTCMYDFHGGTRLYCIRCGEGCKDADKPAPLCKRGGKPNYIDMPPYSFMLAESIERFDIPRDILVVNVGKSTYARCGLIVNVTPGEPEWNGVWTLELTNPTPRTLRVYAGEGIMQSMFFRSDARYELLLGVVADYLGLDPDPNDVRPSPEFTKTQLAQMLRDLCFRTGQTFKDGTCATSYADKAGKYQGQTGLTVPTVDGKNIGELIRSGPPPAGGKELGRIEISHPDTSIQLPLPRPGVRGWAHGGKGVVCLDCGYTYMEPRNHSRDGRVVCRNAQPNEMVWLDDGKSAEFASGPTPPDDPRPPTDADKKKPWPSPDGSLWRWSDDKDDWIQVTYPAGQTPRS